MKKSKTQLMIIIAALVLQCVILMLLFFIHRSLIIQDELTFIEFSMVAALVTFLTIILLVLQLARPGLLHSKAMTFLSCLLHCTTVGFVMILWDDASKAYIMPPFLLPCAVAILSCALLLYTLKWNPVVYLVPGGLFAFWGLLEAFVGESIFVDPYFSLLFLEAGMLLLVIGWILRKQTNIPQKAAPATTQSAATASEPVVTPASEPAAVPAAPAPRVLTCRHCGAALENGDIYCAECGEKQ